MALPGRGRNPRPTVPVDRVDRQLYVVKGAYVRDLISVEEFEEAVEHVLAGGDIDKWGKPIPWQDENGRPIARKPSYAKRVRM